jgi:hypothetical protein
MLGSSGFEFVFPGFVKNNNFYFVFSFPGFYLDFPDFCLDFPFRMVQSAVFFWNFRTISQKREFF